MNKGAMLGLLAGATALDLQGHLSTKVACLLAILLIFLGISHCYLLAMETPLVRASQELLNGSQYLNQKMDAVLSNLDPLSKALSAILERLNTPRRAA